MATCQNAIRGTNEYHLTVTFDEAESIRDAVFESPCEYLDDVYHDLNVLLNNYGDGIVNLTIGLTEEQAVCLLRALTDAPSSDTDEAFWALTTALENEGITMPYICECDGCNWEDASYSDPLVAYRMDQDSVDGLCEECEDVCLGCPLRQIH